MNNDSTTSTATADAPHKHGLSPEVRKRFIYWQNRTLIATMVGYALFYFVRKNFSFAMTGMETDLGIPKTSLGIFLTLHGVIYGVSRVFNGVLADRVNARFFMAIGLALCALANFAFGFGQDIAGWITGVQDGSQFTNTLILFMGILWVLNGWLQGMGFPPLRTTVEPLDSSQRAGNQNVDMEHVTFGRSWPGRNPLRLHHGDHGRR